MRQPIIIFYPQAIGSTTTFSTGVVVRLTRGFRYLLFGYSTVVGVYSIDSMSLTSTDDGLISSGYGYFIIGLLRDFLVVYYNG